MAKTKISNADLVWVFTERLRSFDECAAPIPIAIVPNNGDWSVILSRRGRQAHRLCAKRIEQVQRELRKIYILAKD